MNKVKYLIISIVLIVMAIAGYFAYKKYIIKPAVTTKPTSVNTTTVSAPTPTPDIKKPFVEPIADFKSRITNKPFGIYITQENSPVQPERFSGFHTGVDVEYQDVENDVPVYAISDGSIVYSNWVSGYGGVLIIDINIDGTNHSVLYGHLRPSTLPKVGTSFKKGDQMAVLGTGYSTETDSERRHLHFAVLSNDRIDLKGYVQSQAELSGWQDAIKLYE